MIETIKEPLIAKRFLTAYMCIAKGAVNLFGVRSTSKKVRMIGMSYTPQQIANFFLDKAEEERLSMSQLKLIKMVYIAYGWNLALTGDRLFEEPIHAWKHGPVIDSLYHEFKHFKKAPISGRSEEVDFDTWDTINPRIPDEDKNTRLILNKVWAAYRRFTAWNLRNMTHEVGGPWHKVYRENVDSIRLEDEDIREHYSKRIASYLERTQ